MSASGRGDGIDPAARTRARRRAVQALYAWELGGNSMRKVINDFRSEQDMQIADLEYFEDLLRGVEAHRAELDAGIAPLLNHDNKHVDQIERAIFNLYAYELKHHINVPYRVVLNEAVEVAKRFGSEQGHTYVNGVLDKLARAWRVSETSG